jgi:hypothetical protein
MLAFRFLDSIQPLSFTLYLFSTSHVLSSPYIKFYPGPVPCTSLFDLVQPICYIE